MNRLKKGMIRLLQGILLPVLIPVLSQPLIRKGKITGYYLSRVTKKNTVEGHHTRIDFPYDLRDVNIGDYTYISVNSCISMTEIGKFCSIGPNFFCGWGIHPTNGISTSPLFYSTRSPFSFCTKNKIEDRKKIIIGNDVFIGANVTVLDGVTIGDGAVIGAGAVVSKDIPPYAIAVGSPIQIIKYRFDKETIRKLLDLKWWDLEENELIELNNRFFNVDTIIKDHEKLKDI
jgi:acetyltransferase-like isoleucine patch superfamily enzyme